MNQSLLMMLGMGGRIDGANLRKMVAEANERRKRLYTKLAEILFSLVFFIWGGLTYKATDGAGKAIERKDYTPEMKLDAIMAGVEVTQKGQLFREFLKPLVITAAEFLADAMAPDEMTMMLLSGGVPGMPALPGGVGPFGNSPGAGAPGQSYEGKFLGASDMADGHVWHIVGGKKQWVTSPAVLARYGISQPSPDGRGWLGVQYVPQAVIDGFATGPQEN